VIDVSVLTDKPKDLALENRQVIFKLESKAAELHEIVSHFKL